MHFEFFIHLTDFTSNIIKIHNNLHFLLAQIAHSRVRHFTRIGKVNTYFVVCSPLLLLSISKL